MDYHQPVLLTETINLLAVSPDNIYIDCTLGHGGHSQEILSRGGVVYGLDNDPINLNIATNRLADLGISTNFHPTKGNFKDISILVNTINKPIAGIILDLGLSSSQQTGTGRGFSFNDHLSLDMRLDPDKQKLTAEEIINTYSYHELFDIFSRLAQEKLSKLLAQRIISARQKKPIQDGLSLSKIVSDLYHDKSIRTKINPATKIFLALRIVVNQEFDNLKKFLNDSIEIDRLHNTVVCVISFHSGEDRIVKQFIRQHSSQLTNLTPKAITPAHTETLANPLSRSAILRSYKIN
jgi:16S rRNA (cytosine1402-N4)-methyltransferase